ncbi:hypothetical protein CEXT_45001 [Caerostris extrusa]|uniref:Uncharacterized protein n=1 Tax=Caerostris extrusa TaxID=172846 RepID=A0AAV4URF9_CAEEX|nr:hypothetical protein CEXT_45001 [Caerostris extrusa]
MSIHVLVCLQILRRPPHLRRRRRRGSVTSTSPASSWVCFPPLHLLLHHSEARLQVALRGRARGGLGVQGGALLHQSLIALCRDFILSGTIRRPSTEKELVF